MIWLFLISIAALLSYYIGKEVGRGELEKRMRESETSRDFWKDIAMRQKNEIQTLRGKPPEVNWKV